MTAMTDHIQRTIADAQAKLREQERAVLESKRIINSLCKLAGAPEMYPDAAEASSGPSLSIRGDQFYGQPLASSIKAVLDLRRARNDGPASVNQIYESLVAGGFKFETTNEENRK